MKMQGFNFNQRFPFLVTTDKENIENTFLGNQLQSDNPLITEMFTGNSLKRLH